MVSLARLRLCGCLLAVTTAAACSADAGVQGSQDRPARPGPVRAHIGEPRSSPERPPGAPLCAGLRTKPPAAAESAWGRMIDAAAGPHEVGVAAGADDRILFAHGAGRVRTPASNQKLLVSMALLDHLGPDHRIPTRAAAIRVNGSTVTGDLWLIGRGDPTLTERAPGYWGGVRATTIEELAAGVAGAGITEVRGRIMGERGYFDDDLTAPGWQPYVPGRYVQLPSALVLAGNNSGDSRPERAAAAALTRELRRLGVQVTGMPGAGESPQGLTAVAAVRSRPLSEIVGYMNRTSNNFFAEMLGKRLGAESYGPPGTIAKGARSIERWARGHGVRLDANDASGLSYANRISPRGLIRLLGAAEAAGWGKYLRAGLPGPEEGTLRGRLRGLEVRAKTGTLFNGASALSGWVRSTASNRWVAFSIIGRGTPKAVEDRIVGIISRARIPSVPNC